MGHASPILPTNDTSTIGGDPQSAIRSSYHRADPLLHEWIISAPIFQGPPLLLCIKAIECADISRIIKMVDCSCPFTPQNIFGMQVLCVKDKDAMIAGCQDLRIILQAGCLY